MFDINPHAIAVEGVGYDPLTMATLGWMWVSSATISPNAEADLMMARIRMRRGKSSKENTHEEYLQKLVVFVNLESGNTPWIEQFWDIQGYAEQTFVLPAKSMQVLADNVTPAVDDGAGIVIEEAEVIVL